MFVRSRSTCAAVALIAQTFGIAAAETLETVEVLGTREQGYRATVAATANKSDTPAKETPFSVQVVTRELIADRGAISFGEAVRTVPGLTPQVGFNGMNDRFRLRGFATPSNLKNGMRRSVFIPVDEIANIEQIEVLKGPASALYGRFEPGGVVNLITKKPLDEQRTVVEVTAGEESLMRGTLDITGPLSDTVGYRVNAAWQDNQSFRDFVDARTEFISPVLSWRPNEATRVVAEFEYLSREQGLDRGFGNSPLFLTVPIERNYGEPFARGKNISRLASLLIEHQLDERWALRAALQATEGELNGIYVSYGFPPLSGTNTPDPRVNRSARPVFDRERDRSAQIELTGRALLFGVDHRMLVGVEAARSTEHSQFSSAPLGSISFYNPVYGQTPGPVSRAFFNTSNDTVAIYLQDEMLLAKHWRLLIGARYDRADYTSEDAFLLGGARGEGEDAAFSPRVGLTYAPHDAISLYASWAQSFAPDVFARMQDGSVPKPSEGEQVEIGAKLSLLEGRVTPTLAWFDITRRNAPVPDPNDPTFTFSILAGEQRGRGWELDVPVVLTAQWRLIASYTRLDAKFAADPELSGNRLANAPENNASFWTTYDFTSVLRGVSLGTGIHYVAERAANNENTFDLPSYTRWDASVTYRFGAGERYRIQVNAQNLTDRRYYESGGSFTPTYPGAPRTLSATFGARF
jgi:iron complex outermembrane receptor protein